MRFGLASTAACSALLLVLACKRTDEPFARASRITSLDQAIGGPVASARVHDFLLENDRIRAVIEAGRSSRLPLDEGGSLVDLDLVRHDTQFRDGRGLDQLGQIAPTSNLFLAGAESDAAARITHSDLGAEVTVAAEAVPVQKIISALGLLLNRSFISGSYDHSKFRMYTEYQLRPGEQLVRIRSTLGFDVPFCPPQPEDHCNDACDDILFDSDCVCPAIPDRCGAAQVFDAASLPDRPEPMGLSDILLGDLQRPIGAGACRAQTDCVAGETCVSITTALGGQSMLCRAAASRSAGVFLGDMLLFGGHLSIFIPGTGYDTETDIRALFDSGLDTLSEPLKLDAVYALGDRVSYGYAAPSGKVLVPIFGGPFSMGVTGAASCRQDQPGCLSKKLIRGDRWVSVGEGDAVTARQPLALAKGERQGRVTGVVRWAHSGAPVSGAQIFSISDPRDLACDDACKAQCGDLSALTDEAVRGWTARQLFEANRCRTHGGAHLEGVAGVETAARTDVGLDRILDGNFLLPLPVGRHVLIALYQDAASSSPLPISVDEGKDLPLVFWLNEPGRLEYALFDERGQPTPGRVTVGQCQPGAPCMQDADCAAGELCQAGACACPRAGLRPLELGGPRRADGTVALDQTRDGRGEVQLPAGEYDVVFSKGPHVSIDRAHISVISNRATQAKGTLVRTVDRYGWSSADFHVHSEQSLDCGDPMLDRATGFLAEDMDFLSSSDHDVLTRYEPLLSSLGEKNRLQSHVGVEVTTQELGHFIGYPMLYREFQDGAKVDGNGAPEWRRKTPQQIFDAIRATKVPDHAVVVEVPHPYSYFDSYGLDPKTIEPVESIIALFNPLVRAANLSSDYDAMELMNQKSFDLIRRPTVAEVRDYGQGLDALLARWTSHEIDDETYHRLAYQLSTETTRRILHRTPEEQRAALAGDGAELACSCASNGDCSGGRVCDPAKLACVLPSTLSGGPAAKSTGVCRALRGVVDDWFGMLNRGMRRSGVAGSDVHDATELGCPRALIATGMAKGAALTSDQIVQGVLDGKVVVTNGPMIHFQVDGVGPGETVKAGATPVVRLSVRVETGGWYDVDRVEIYRNGELLHWVDGCTSQRDSDPSDGHVHPCVKPGLMAFEQEIDDQPTSDAWYVVIAIGLDGRSLAPVYSSSVLARLGTFEVTQRIYDIVPTLSALRTPRFPSLYPTFPVGITNPIWVDVGGDGWKPPLPAASWCTPSRDVGCTR
jgi:hypothetical protein